MTKKKKSKSRGQTLGATYRAASTGAILASPAALAVFRGQRTPEGVANLYRDNLKEVAGSVLFHAADNFIGQRVFNHNSALGRGSVTAWAAEAIASVDAGIAASKNDQGYGLSRYSLNKTGFAPGAIEGFGGLRQPNYAFPWYVSVKYGGGLVRKLSSMSLLRSVTAPVKKMLGSAGGAL